MHEVRRGGVQVVPHALDLDAPPAMERGFRTSAPNLAGSLTDRFDNVGAAGWRCRAACPRPHRTR
jgi:hypothetical protein